MKLNVGTSLLALAMAMGVILSSSTGMAEELNSIAFTDFKGEAAFEYFHEAETYETETIESESRETIYTETVRLWTKGYIYHPNLFDFNLGVKLGLDQESEEKDSFEDNRNSELLGYNVHLFVERKRPYGFEFFGLKDQQIVQFDFIPDSVVDVTENALVWHTNNSVLPTSIRLSTMTKDQEGLTPRGEDERKITINSSNRIGDFSETLFHYDFRDFKENVGDTKVVDHDVMVTNTLAVADNKKLTSNLHYVNQKDGTTFDQLSASTELDWKHQENLDSFYRIDIVDSSTTFPDSGAVSTLAHSEEAGIHHLLFENLTTTASVHNNSIDSDVFNQEEFGGDLDFIYVRQIPVGSVRANLGFGLKKDSIDSTGGLVPVINEPHIMIDAQPVNLNNVGVDVDSIVVTDLSGTFIYEEGIDYEVLVEGTITRIVRLLTGQILDGQEVLVDYQYQSGEDVDYVSRRIRFGAGATLYDRFSIDYSFQSISPDILSGEATEGSVLDETDNRIDARYYQSWDSGLHYEIDSFIEDRESNVAPVKSIGISGIAGRPFWTRNNALVTSSFSHSTYPDTDRVVDVMSFSGNWTTFLNPRTNISFLARYDDISGTNEQTALELRLKLEIYIRLMTFSLNLSHIDATNDGQDRQTDTIFFRATRQF
jgi:hypothetical protein